MATRARAPRREASPAELAERLKELEGARKEEQKSKVKEEKRKQKEMADAKKKIAREMQNASKAVKKGEQDVKKLVTMVSKTETQAEQAKSQKARQLQMLEQNLGKMSTKRNTLEQTLHDKAALVGEARGKLAHIHFAAKMLEAGVIIPTDGEVMTATGTAQPVPAVPCPSDAPSPTNAVSAAVQDMTDERVIVLEEENQRLQARVLELEQKLLDLSSALATPPQTQADSLGACSQRSSYVALEAAGSKPLSDTGERHVERSPAEQAAMDGPGATKDFRSRGSTDPASVRPGSPGGLPVAFAHRSNVSARGDHSSITPASAPVRAAMHSRETDSVTHSDGGRQSMATAAPHVAAHHSNLSARGPPSSNTLASAPVPAAMHSRETSSVTHSDGGRLSMTTAAPYVAHVGRSTPEVRRAEQNSMLQQGSTPRTVQIPMAFTQHSTQPANAMRPNWVVPDGKYPGAAETGQPTEPIAVLPSPPMRQASWGFGPAHGPVHPTLLTGMRAAPLVAKV